MAPRRCWVEARAKVVREGCCRNCGTTRGLEAAHLIPRSRVGPLGGAEDARNIIPMCGDLEHGCHRAYDEHRLNITPLVTPDERAYMVHLVGEGETQRRTGGTTWPAPSSPTPRTPHPPNSSPHWT